MTDDIKPALTPEEWAVQQTLRPGFPGAIAYDTDVTVGEGFDSVSFAGEARHALAALALHGQPFGFTREHLLAVTWAARNTAANPAFAREAVQLQEAAARIAALLPPEGAE